MIFIHSGFRTSSTYVWSRFRANQNTVSYCEIFNEALGGLTPSTIRKASQDTWLSKHPAGAPYFLEFLPLLRQNGGVIGFDESFSFERFIPVDGPAGPVSELEVQYMQGLVQHAEARGKIPVLTATRSLGRVTGIKNAVPGLHVLLYRNLFHQWCSVTEQIATGNRYFLDKTTDIARMNGHDPVLRELASLFPISQGSEKDPNTFYLFALTHIYLYAHAAAAADVILDANRLADDRAYQSEMEAVFGGQNLGIDFSGARQSLSYSLINGPSREEFSEQMRVVGDAINSQVASETGRRFAARVIEDFLDQFERYEFHTKGIRSILTATTARRDSALSELDEALRQRDQLAAERTSLSSERDHASLDRDRVRAELQQVLQDRDNLQEQKNVVIGERNQLEFDRNMREAELVQIRFERENLRTDVARFAAERDQTGLDRDAARAAARALQQDRDRLQGVGEAIGLQRDQLLVDHETARTAIEELVHERERLQAVGEAIGAQRDQLLADRDIAQAMIERLNEDRDRLQAVGEAIGAERDHLAVDREAALAASRDRCDDLRADGIAIREERDRLAEERDRLTQARDQLAEERDRLAEDRDMTRIELDRIRKERDRQKAETDARAVEIATLREQLDRKHWLVNWFRS